MTETDRIAIPNNILDRLDELERQVAEIKGRDTVAEALSEITSDFGDMVSGRFIAPSDESTSTEPTDSGFTGAFVSGSGELFDNLLAYIGSSAQGQLQAGFVQGGGIYALGGDMIMDAEGLSIFGMSLAQYFEATNGGETRRAYLGMNLPQDATVPVFSILYTGPEGTNLVSNGDFETGDLTGWTDSDSAWEISSTSPYEDTYSAFHDGTNGIFGGDLSGTVTVTAGDIVTVSFAHRRANGILAGRLAISWKNSGGTVISTDYIYGTTSSSWTTFTQNFLAPATTASAGVTWEVADPFNDEYIDEVIVYATDTLVELRLSDAAMTAHVNGVEYNLLAGAPVGFAPFAECMGFVQQPVLTDYIALSLVANGGVLASPVKIETDFRLESVSVVNTNTSTQRAWNWALYKQSTNTGSSSENTLTRVAVGGSAETFTPSARSVRTITASGSPVTLGRGVYWIVIQNTHASNAFNLGTYLGHYSMGQTKTLSVPLGNTLDFVAATWAKSEYISTARLNGQVFGQTSAF